jgi:nitrate reductase NapAB chaperone NapD
LVITGSAIFVRPQDNEYVMKRLREFPQITFHVSSQNGSELIVNFEAENQDTLEKFCLHLRCSIPEIIDIGHIYLNFEEEIDCMKGLIKH